MCVCHVITTKIIAYYLKLFFFDLEKKGEKNDMSLETTVVCDIEARD